MLSLWEVGLENGVGRSLLTDQMGLVMYFPSSDHVS